MIRFWYFKYLKQQKLCREKCHASYASHAGLASLIWKFIKFMGELKIVLKWEL